MLTIMVRLVCATDGYGRWCIIQLVCATDGYGGVGVLC